MDKIPPNHGRRPIHSVCGTEYAAMDRMKKDLPTNTGLRVPGGPGTDPPPWSLAKSSPCRDPSPQGDPGRLCLGQRVESGVLPGLAFLPRGLWGQVTRAFLINIQRRYKA